MGNVDNVSDELETTTEEQIDNSQEVEQPQDNEGKSTDKNWEQLAKHYQKLGDQRYEENRKLKADAELAQKIKSNPELLRLIEEKTSGKAELQKPVAPQMPDGYDEVDAYSDPKSESWKYRKQHERYVLQNQEYLAKQLEERALRDQENAKKSQQQIEYERQLKDTEALVMTKHGLTKSEARDFIDFANNPENFNIDLLVDIFKQRTKKSTTKAQQIMNNGKTETDPLPAGATATKGSGGEIDVNDVFNSQLLKKYAIKK